MWWDDYQVVVPTLGATPNTKTAWTQLIASLDHDVFAWQLGTSYFNPKGDLLYDIGIGGAGSEVVIAPNVYLFGNSSGSAFYDSGVNHVVWQFIPKGSRVAIRYQGSGASLSFEYSISFLKGANGVRGSLTDVVGGATGDSGGIALTTGSWTEIVSSAAHDYDEAALFIGHRAATSGADQNGSVEIGLGGAGSEVSKFRTVVRQSNALDNVIQLQLRVPLKIAKGQRIAVRMNTGTGMDNSYDAVLALTRFNQTGGAR